MVSLLKLPGFQCVFNCVTVFCFLCAAANAQESEAEFIPAERLISILDASGAERDEIVAEMNARWRDEYVPMILELTLFTNDGAFNQKLINTLEDNTDESFGYNVNEWYRWLWSKPAQLHPGYPTFKTLLYKRIDPQFAVFFTGDREFAIQLDEVQWGGVKKDGIPPLHTPAMITAAEATYLSDDNIVFGIEIEGDARAYPKRILAWHELFTDRIGGVPVTGVYCTLCGSMIAYKSRSGGVEYTFGTSGFLYRSNKLMYDSETQSLWSALWGAPVIGPLAEKNIELERLSVVTTTWGEWRRRHPLTTTLSLETGHKRDYSEGAAYADYFATDDLYFQVPKRDDRLNNKDEVLGLVFDAFAERPLAISVDFLRDNILYQDTVGTIDILVLTDRSGAHRVYDRDGLNFTKWNGKHTVFDADGVEWRMTESRLIADDGSVLERLPAHRAFWFAWYAAFESTRLVE